MAGTNFKLFDENKANIMSDNDYNQNTQRLNGVQTGVASSALHNKLEYQNSLMVNALAQFMVSQGYDAKDTSTPTVFNSNLVNAFNKYIHNITDVIEITLTEAVNNASQKADNALLAAGSCYEFVYQTSGAYTLNGNKSVNVSSIDFSKYSSLLFVIMYKIVGSYDYSNSITNTIYFCKTNSISSGQKQHDVQLFPQGSYSLNLAYPEQIVQNYDGKIYAADGSGKITFSELNYIIINDTENAGVSTTHNFKFVIYGLKKGS